MHDRDLIPNSIIHFSETIPRFISLQNLHGNVSLENNNRLWWIKWGTRNLMPLLYYYTCPVDRIQSPLWPPIDTERLSEPFCLPKPHFVSKPVQMFLIASTWTGSFK